MKKKMLSAEIEFIKFSTDDVITTSGGGSDTGKIPYKTKLEEGAPVGSPATTTGWTNFGWNQ